MTEIYLKVKVFAGADINKVIKEMIEFSKRILIPISSSFNGMLLMAHPTSKAEDIVYDYYAQLAYKAKAQSPNEI